MVLFTVWFLSVGCGELCLQIHLSVRWLVAMFAIVFVSLLVGGYVWYWVCLFVGWWLCDNIISFNYRDGVSVGLFYYFYLFIYLGLYIAFNTVQVISRRVVGRAEEAST